MGILQSLVFVAFNILDHFLILETTFSFFVSQNHVPGYLPSCYKSLLKVLTLLYEYLSPRVGSLCPDHGRSTLSWHRWFYVMNLYKTSNFPPEIQTHRFNHLLESLLCCTIIFVDSTYPKLTSTFSSLNLPFYLVFLVSVNNPTSSSGARARNLEVIWLLYPPDFSTCSIDSTLVQQPGWIFQSKIISLS